MIFIFQRKTACKSEKNNFLHTFQETKYVYKESIYGATAQVKIWPTQWSSLNHNHCDILTSNSLHWVSPCCGCWSNSPTYHQPYFSPMLFSNENPLGHHLLNKRKNWRSVVPTSEDKKIGKITENDLTHDYMKKCVDGPLGAEVILTTMKVPVFNESEQYLFWYSPIFHMMYETRLL